MTTWRSTPRRLSSQTVTFVVGDLMTLALPSADVVTANLTGGVAHSGCGTRLGTGVPKPGGVLMVSGLLACERDEGASGIV